MNFGKELENIRKSKGFNIKEFAKRIGVPYGTYYKVEKGTITGHSNSAKRILRSDVFSQADRQRFRHFYLAEEKEEKQISDERKLAYRRRKNAIYFKNKRAENNRKEFKQAKSRSAIQKVFF